MKASLEVTDPARIAELRRAKHLTRAELARAAGISRSTLRRCENPPSCRVSASRANRIAEALGVKRHELFKVVE